MDGRTVTELRFFMTLFEFEAEQKWGKGTKYFGVRDKRMALFTERYDIRSSNEKLDGSWRGLWGQRDNPFLAEG